MLSLYRIICHNNKTYIRTYTIHNNMFSSYAYLKFFALLYNTTFSARMIYQEYYCNWRVKEEKGKKNETYERTDERKIFF